MTADSADKTLSPVKQALLELKSMRHKLDEIEREKSEPIAVIGIGLRFPGGADSPEKFWQLLRDGVDAVKEIPPSRWDVNTYYDPDPDAPGKMYVREGGFLHEDISQFDPTFFGISPREAQSLDPQQRLLMEVSWEALENAGLAPDKLDGSETGVFVGIGGSTDYAFELLLATDAQNINAYVGPGATYSAAAGRLSYFYGLKGPAMSIDTACSSSLVAVHLAGQSLRNRECNMALVGGVTLHLQPHSFVNQSKLRMVSPDGRSKAFDASGDGVGRGEGCGVVVLKRFSDAVADGDNILALIRGSAVNQDGRTSGLTAPNGPSQQTVIRRALTSADVEPGQVHYLEAHGTGTPLGDPIEVQAAAAVYGETRPVEQPLLMGSVKTNIGHLEEGAGVASLIKVALALQNREIPPSLHYKQPNPYIPWERLPVKVNTELTPWPEGNGRLAAISSFGWSGTNAHVVLEEAPPREIPPVERERPQHLLMLSAKSEPALQELVQRYDDLLAAHAEAEDFSLADVCFTANTGRAGFPYRLGVVADSIAETRSQLAAYLAGRMDPGIAAGKIQEADSPEIAFLFTGQGSQYVGMGRQLYETQPAFRAALDRCDQLLRPHMDRPLLSLLFPEEGEADASSPSLLDETVYTQPALFALEYSLATLWRSWGIEPSVVTGHSVGEYVAACLAGVFSLEDGLRLIAERGRLMQMLPKGGAMFNVFTSEERVQEAIAPYGDRVSIAALNGPEIVVISGEKAVLQAVIDELKADEIRAWPLAVSHALHTAGMESILDEFEELASTITYSAPKLKMVSMLTGQFVAGDEIATPAYWRRHMRQAVRFSDAIVTLHEKGYRVYLEVGPDPKLTTMGQLCVPEGSGAWIPSLRQKREEWHQLLESVGMLYVQGVAVDWAKIDHPYAARRRHVSLPTYPFQRQRYWFEPRGERPSPPERMPAGSKGDPFADWFYELVWQSQPRQPADAAPEDAGRAGDWLILADRQGIGAAIADQLAARGQRCALVYPGSTFEKMESASWRVDPARPDDFDRLLREVIGEDERPLRGVVHLWSLDDTDNSPLTPASLRTAQTRGSGSALHLVQALARAGSVPRLWLATQGAQPVGEAEAAAVAQAPLWGLGHVIALEHPDWHCVRVDLDPAASPKSTAQALFGELWQPDAEDRIAFRDGTRYAARLTRKKLREQQANGHSGEIEIQADATYLITGGMGGLGLLLAHWLVEQGARHLVLVGRSAPSAEAQEAIAEMEQAGAEVAIGRADVAQAEQVTRLLAQIDETMPSLRGVIHAAGTLDDGVLLQQNWERFLKVMAPKVEGSWNLHTLTQERPLDFFLMYSTSVALFGSPGQGNYAAANSFLDALAHYRRAQGLPALSVNWGGWAQVGTAAALERESDHRWAALGVSLIPPEQGLQVLAHLLRQDVTQIAVLPVQWSQFMQHFAAGQAPPLLSQVAGTALAQTETGQPAGDRPPELMQQLQAVPPSQRRELLVANVQAQALQVLALDPSFPLDREQPLTDLGLDSLMAVQLRNVLSARLGRPLPATLLFNYPTVADLTDYLSRELLPEIAASTEITTGMPAKRALKDEPIAIVGMSCRFPGANSITAFWELLRDGVDAISEVPADRWNAAAYFDPEPGAPGKTYTRWGGFIEDVDKFDPQFFGISPREAIAIDPQQRLLLEISWEALENAGYAPTSLNGSQTGVFVGIGNYDYAQLQLKQSGAESVDSYSGSGSALSMAAGRLSYILGLQGPSMAVDTACSSSLVALHLACRSLASGECDAALAGGVNLILTPEPTISLSQARMMAADGRCKTFDAAANGFVRSEGCGVVVLKRLSDAIASGDNVLALIRGTAVNQDGRSQGLTAPNGLAQEAVIGQALKRAGVSPRQIDYIEAHGTGTALGDPIEVEALGAVYCPDRSETEQLIVGSVKTNIGHLENAAGIAGLIKVVLSLQHEIVPPHLHLQQPNPYIPWDELPIEIPTTLKAWPSGNGQRLAGLSSFGFSGTNAHAIIAEAPARDPVDAAVERPLHLFTLSAQNEKALRQLTGRYGRHLADHDHRPADLCYTANVGRNHFSHRLAIKVTETSSLQTALAGFSDGEIVEEIFYGEGNAVNNPRIVFLFTGQGAQYAGMGRELYETQPTFRAILDECDALSRPYLERPLLSAFYPEDEETAALINETAYTQPALFALEYALAKLWQSWGIEPAAVMGHSNGEFAAACAAGVLSFEDGLKLVAERGRLMQALPRNGAMAAVFADEARVQAAIGTHAVSHAGQISIAAVNGPNNVVISGLETAVDAVVAGLREERIKSRRLSVSHAFHSPLMEPMLDDFEAVAASVSYAPPQIGLVAAVTGQMVREDELSDVTYWRRNVRDAVRFADAIATLSGEGYDLFVEVGPAPTLLGMGRRCWPEQDEPAVWLPSLRKGQGDWSQMLDTLATLYVGGAEVDWPGFERDYAVGRRRIPLPTYPFQRQRYWFEAAGEGTRRSLPAPPPGREIHPLLGQRLPSALKEIQFETQITAYVPSFLARRRLRQQIQLPHTAYIEMALAAAGALFETALPAIENLTVTATPPRLGSETQTIQVILTPNGAREGMCQIFGRAANGDEASWQLLASAEVSGGDGAAPSIVPLEPVPLEAVRDRCREVAVDSYYEALEREGLAYEGQIRPIDQLWQGEDEALGRLQAPDGAEGYYLHPLLLEACCGLLAMGRSGVYAPVRLGRLQIFDEGVAYGVRPVWGYGRAEAVDAASVTGDLYLLDETGAPVAALTDLHLETVEAVAEQPAQPDYDQWLYQIEWRVQPREAETAVAPTRRPGQWLILADAGGVGEALAGQLRQQGESCYLVRPDTAVSAEATGDNQPDPADPEAFKKLLRELMVGEKRPLRGIIHLWSLDVPALGKIKTQDLEQAQLLTLGSSLHVLQALAATLAAFKPAPTAEIPRVWLVTQRSQPVAAGDDALLAAAQAPLWGLGKTIALEHPKLLGKLIDLDVTNPERNAADLLAEIWRADDEPQVAYRQGERYVARLAPQGKALRQTQPVHFRPDGAYLISGGLGDLGMVVARWLVEHGARRLILLGRTPLPPRATWSQVEAAGRQAKRIQAVRELEGMGASVHVAAVDVADEDQLGAFLTTYEQEGWPPIRGVVHAAGLVQDRSLLQMDLADLVGVLRPKVVGGWLLHQGLRKAPLDFFLMFSSAASLLGSPGQANYAAANAFLEALAHYRRSQGQPALSINWGPWAEVGMAARVGPEGRRGPLAMAGIAPEQGVEILGRLLWSDQAQVGVMAVTPTQLHRLAPMRSPFLAELGEEVAEAEAEPAVEGLVGDQIAAAPAAERVALMIAHLKERIGRSLMMAPATIPVERNMMELGLDSIMIMELIQELDRDLGLTLFPREIFERPSIKALAEYLLAELKRTRAAGETGFMVPDVMAESGALQKPAQAIARPTQRNPGIIFLLSTPRAGSTLLRVMLAGHPALFSPPELHLLPFNTMAERHAELGHSYLSEGLQYALAAAQGLDDAQSEAMLAQWVEENLPIQDVYRRLQAAVEPRVLVDKSPTYALDMAVLERAEALFEDPKYIYLARHPYAVIDSIARNRLHKLYRAGDADPLKFGERLWASMNGNILDFLETIGPGRRHQIAYEDLVTDPQQVMRELSGFLDIPFDAAILTPYEGERMKEKSMAVGDSDFFHYQQIDSAKATAWQTVDLPRRLGGFARRVAAELDYDIPWPLEKARKPAPTSTATPLPLQPVPREGKLPLSFGQRRLLFMELLEPGMPMYNVPVVVRLNGALDLAALQQSLNKILERHEVLRTNFVMEDGAGTQTIIPMATAPWDVVDLVSLPETEREAERRRLTAAEIRKPFDLAEDVQLRAKLLRLGVEDHVLILTMHHIASDGWSTGILMRELLILYESIVGDRPIPLPDLPIQYADYAYWQQQWLQGEALEADLSYWKQQLSGTPVLELPTDRPRPPVQTYRGDRFPVKLPTSLTAALKQLSREEGVTLFMTLLAAFQALLYRYTGQDDIAVGSPIAGRNQPETRNLIGFFLNTLVLRADLSGNPTFRDLLKQVRRAALDAYEHQELPFDKLVEELQPARNLSHSPLFQVMFALQNMPMPGAELTNLSITRLTDVTTGTSMFDVFVPLWETEEGLAGQVEYNTDLFDAETIGRMMRHWETLLTVVVENPEQRLADLPLLTPTERRRILVEWNNTAIDYPREACLHQLVAEQAARSPDAAAVLFGEEQLTYRELNERANQLAHYLQKLGVGPETLVGIHMERSLQMVVGLLGILKAGGAYVPLDPAFPPERLSYIVADSQAKVLLTQESLQHRLAPAPDVNVVCLDSDRTAVARESGDAPDSQVTPDNLAYVIHTSGSTGTPKGVQLQHQGVVNFLTTMRQKPGLSANDVLLSVTTLSFDIAVLEIFLPLTTGACLVVAGEETAADGARLITELEQRNVTVMQATPATWRLLIEAGWSGTPGLKVLCGGEALPRDLADQLLERSDSLWNMYGPTETTIWSTTTQVEPGDGPISIGRPIGNTQCYILDEQMEPVPIGVTGELYIGGDGVARGYLNRPQLTRERFLPDPFSDMQGTCVYKTGDQARYRPDGAIEFLGRIDHQVKIRGFRIELGEIEHVLGQHTAVQANVVIVREDVPGDKRLVAYIIGDQEQLPPVSELRRFLSESLPGYMVPSNFVQMEAFPLTPNGKVNRRALPPPGGERPELESDFVAPQSEVEQAVAGLWKDVLQIDGVGIHDNFFDLGGHSMLLAQVHSKLQKELSVELPIVKLFQYPTISSLTGFLNQKEDQATSQQQISERAERQKAALARRKQRLMRLRGTTDE